MNQVRTQGLLKQTVFRARSISKIPQLLWVSFLCMGLFSGCATIGFKFAEDKVNTIHVGETTQDQILKRFGNPWRVGLEDGFVTWTYGQYRVGLFGDQFAKDLIIKFDKTGVVLSYSYNTTDTGSLKQPK